MKGKKKKKGMELKDQDQRIFYFHQNLKTKMITDFDQSLA